jgi:7-carboxy-7-deazaguanine synthase
MTTLYNISDIYPAIQGEGCQTGIPMVILRTQGCAVGCSFCDSKATWALNIANQVLTIPEALGDSEKYVCADAETLATYIKANYPTFQWVLLTGGEPAEQDLADLVKALHRAGYKVALETSGTAGGHIGVSFDWICVSPKIGMPGGKGILSAAVRPADEIKFVIGKLADLAKLEKFLQDYPTKATCTVCVQPMSASEKATQLCIEAAQKKGYRLSLQTHKLISQR